MAFGLRQKLQGLRAEIQLGCVNQYDCRRSGACARNHIARVLFVPRRVGDDEFPFRRGKIAVCHIDRNALFAFGFQSVGQDGEVYGFFQTVAFAGFQGFDLVGQQGFAVVEQSSD